MTAPVIVNHSRISSETN